VAWLVGLGGLGAAGAQQEAAEQAQQEDIPDHMELFQQAPPGDDTSEEPGTGGAGEAGAEAEQGELSGEVVRADEERLWLRHGGAVLPLALTEQTRLVPGREVLEPGREVRARFLILPEQGYVATSVEPAR
jgi:hypothetical protein